MLIETEKFPRARRADDQGRASESESCPMRVIHAGVPPPTSNVGAIRAKVFDLSARLKADPVR